MPEGTWVNLAIQVPIVVLFAYVMLKMQDRFLQHLDDADKRAEAFIAAQRTEADKALHRLTDSICIQLDRIDSGLHILTILNAGHDAFVRTSFKERFGAMEKAERAAAEAEQRVN